MTNEYKDVNVQTEDFNQWVDMNMPLPAGYYTHDQLRRLCWLSWVGAIVWFAAKIGGVIVEPPS
jgi:hypothetical protein